MAASKMQKSVVITDIDNTITDFFGMWAKVMDKTLDRMAQSRKIERQTIETEMKQLPRPYRFHDLAGAMKKLPCLQPKSPQEAMKFKRDDARILHQWNKERGDLSKLYDGVVDTMKSVKQAGGKFVIFTDSPAASTVSRLAQMKIPSDLVDAVYTQPNVNKDLNALPPLQVDNPESKIMHDLAAKTVEFAPDTRKPNPESMLRILKDMGAKPEEAIMVGDNAADGGSAVPVGVTFAWQKQGADVDALTIDMQNNRLGGDNGYMVGVDATKAKFNATNRPDVVLENGYKDMAKHFTFVPTQKDQQKQKAEKNQSKNTSTVMAAALASQRSTGKVAS
jgi:phosphoglycolate phosphatase